MAKSEPIRDIKEIEQIQVYYIGRGQIRNYVLFTVGIYTALRISDLLNLKWDDVYNFSLNSFHNHLYIREQKTKKIRKIALNKNVIEALTLYRSTIPNSIAETWLFPSRKKANPISRIQAYRIIRNAVDELNIQGNISCHSMRKIIGYHSWKVGVPLPLISEIYNHSSEKVTKHYLGIRQDEIDEVYLRQNYKTKPRKAVKYEK